MDFDDLGLEMETLIPATVLYVIGVGIMITTFYYWQQAGMALGWSLKVGGPILLAPISYFIVKNISNR